MIRAAKLGGFCDGEFLRAERYSLPPAQRRKMESPAIPSHPTGTVAGFR